MIETSSSHSIFGNPKKPSAEDLACVENACSLAATIGAEQLRACGDLSLELLATGKSQMHWANETAGKSIESFFDALALLEAGTADELTEMLEKIHLKAPYQQRVIIISTRPNTKEIYFDGPLAEQIRKPFRSLEEVQLIDADPKLTASYFEIT